MFLTHYTNGIEGIFLRNEKYEAYIGAREDFFSLPIFSVESSSSPKSFQNDSLGSVIGALLRDLKTIARFGISRSERLEVKRSLRGLESASSEAQCLIVGNGPSVATLTSAQLRKFKAAGNSIYAVNYYNELSHLSSVYPTDYVLSDPLDESEKEYESLRNYIREADSLVWLPYGQNREFGRNFDSGRVRYFCDRELISSFWKKIWPIGPLFPRSFVSMTLYKALSIAVWRGCQQIFVIGMDNTYPHDVFVDPENCLWQRYHHGSERTSTRIWRSGEYDSIADFLYEHARVFSDLSLFPSDRIINLDPFSLSDAFTKIRADSFLETAGIEVSRTDPDKGNNGLGESDQL